MATEDDALKTKIEDLARRTEAVNQGKAKAAGLLAAKRAELAELLKEIQEAGYDPRTLVATRDQLRADLESEVAAYEKDLEAAERALIAINQTP